MQHWPTPTFCVRGSGSPAPLARKLSLSTYYCVNPHLQEPSQMCVGHCSADRLEVMVRWLYWVYLFWLPWSFARKDPASFRSQTLHFCSNQLYLQKMNRKLKQQHVALLQRTDSSWGRVHLKACWDLGCAVNVSLGLCCALFTRVLPIIYPLDLLATVMTPAFTWANIGILLP